MAFTTIQGSGANDATSFVGTSGVDTITINAGTIQGSGSVFAGGQQAGDTINVLSPTGGVSGYTIRGGQGADTIALIANTSITSSFINANSDNDTLNFANSFSSTTQGGQGNDTFNINGLVFQSVVNGNKGNDTLGIAGVQGSSIFGGQGTDTINTAAATYTNSRISGDNDRDTIQLTTASTFTSTTIEGGNGNDSINSGAGALTAWTSSSVLGGQGNDNINFTNAGVAVNLYGGDDADIIVSGAGADILSGEAGIDNLTNTGGADTITGGTGTDTIVGFASTTVAERFVQSAGDSAVATAGFNLAGDGSLIEDGSTITFGNGVDTITNFNLTAGAATLDLLSTGIAGARNLTAASGSVANLAAGNYTIIGDFTAGTGQFNLDNTAGISVLFLQTTGGSLATAANTGTSSVVLTFADNAGAAAFVAAQATSIVA